MQDNEKRSSDELIPGSDHHQARVGGRHKQRPWSLEGGGYPDICSISAVDFTAKVRKSDPRLQELREVGVSEKWVDLACIIGFEAFIGVWMYLGGDESYRIRGPPYSKYAKFRRNQLIRRLALADGLLRCQPALARRCLGPDRAAPLR